MDPAGQRDFFDNCSGAGSAAPRSTKSCVVHHNITVHAVLLSICEQWGSRAPLGAAELYMEGSCCWRCLFPTSLMIRGHCPVFPDQQVWARSHAPCGGALQTVECNVAVDCGKVNLTGWVRTKFSNSVRALAARLM